MRFVLKYILTFPVKIMARDNPITVRFEDLEESFLVAMAKKDTRKVGTLLYIGIREYMVEHGFNEYVAEHKLNVAVNKKL